MSWGPALSRRSGGGCGVLRPDDGSGAAFVKSSTLLNKGAVADADAGFGLVAEKFFEARRAAGERDVFISEDADEQLEFGARDVG